MDNELVDSYYDKFVEFFGEFMFAEKTILDVKEEIKNDILEILDIEFESIESAMALSNFFNYLDEIKTGLNKNSFATRVCEVSKYVLQRSGAEDDNEYCECEKDCNECITALTHCVRRKNDRWY